MILVIDNYDSFTFNLVQYLGELSNDYAIAKQIDVRRNDSISSKDIEEINPSAILISPGPGDPDQSGICMDVVLSFGAQIPILGVCLGHQVIAQCYGGSIVRADELMHGKTSKIFHEGEGVFSGLPKPFIATRYHSLVADKKTLPECLETTAWLEDGTIMAVRHRSYPHLQGVQFHPESVLTEHGHALLGNFLSQT